MGLMQKVMIVTGASRGIGAATARLAAERGYAVCVCYRDQHERAGRLVAEIERAGGKAISVGADLSRESEVLRLFETVDERLGRVAVLVNNAGVLEKQMPLEQMDAARIQRVFAINVLGAFLCAREAVRRMSLSHGGQGGTIVNVSSRAARLGSPHEYVDYAASKGAIDTMTVGLAREVAAEGIRVNAVRPGLIDTEMHASGGEPGRIERLKGSVPLQRGGMPSEVAQAILWLASDEASYTTGSFIDVSGGR
jgi:NAD(P)-dependent dehydrogenase (short-subunit alcohol dehydrogenase family)